MTLTGSTLGADDPSKAHDRSYYVHPASGDEPGLPVCTPHRVVYVLPACGEMMPGRSRDYARALDSDGDTLFVALAPPAGQGVCPDVGSGAESEEWEAFAAIHEQVQRRYCIDKNRVYVLGLTNSAGRLAHLLGCYFAGRPAPPLDAPEVLAALGERKFMPHSSVRGFIASVGVLPDNAPLPCNGPVASLWFDQPGSVLEPLADVESSLQQALDANGCTGSLAGPSVAWEPGVTPNGPPALCQRFTACPAAAQRNYPLIFCNMMTGQTDGSSTILPLTRAFFDQVERGTP